MKFEELPQPNPVENQELPIQNLETNSIPVHQENVGISEADIIARKEADVKKIAELREQLGLQPEISPVNPNPEVPSVEVLEEEVALEQEETLTPEMAAQKLFSDMDELEIKKSIRTR